MPNLCSIDVEQVHRRLASCERSDTETQTVHGEVPYEKWHYFAGRLHFGHEALLLLNSGSKSVYTDYRHTGTYMPHSQTFNFALKIPHSLCPSWCGVLI